MTTKEKIKKYIDFKGISKNKFYLITGLSTSFLDSGNTIGVDKAKIIIEKFPDLSLDWLVMDCGPMLRDERPAQPSAPVPDTSIYEERLADKDKIIQRDSELITALQHRIASLERNGSAHSDASVLRSARTAE